MKVPAFVRKITAKGKKNVPRSSSTSPSSEDDVGVAERSYRPRSARDIEKDGLASKYAPVDEDEEAPLSIELNTEVAAPPKCIPSINLFLSEHLVDDNASLSSSNEQHLETEAEDTALHQRRSSRRVSYQSEGSLSSIGDFLTQICGDEQLLDNSKMVPTQRQPRKKSMSMNSLTMSMTSLSHGMENTTGKCPFKHGTVYDGPYPGYVHGNPKRGICPNGCKAEMNRVITEGESTAETMMREAMEYLELYYHERDDDMSGTEGFLPKKERMIQVRRAIYETGTYVHTFDELGKISFFMI